MVTSITPIVKQHTPRAQVRVGDWSAYVTLEPDAYLDSTTSATQLAKQTHARPHVAITNGTDSYHRNQQSSITAVTTSTGSIAERYAYSAYGQPTILDALASVLSSSAINNRYTYTGREWDATLGLYHFRARWMNPSAGRFLNRDPIGYEGSEWSLNDFGDSSPFNSLDPTGLIIVKTGPHGGSLYGGCETLTTVKTEVVCKYFKLGWWSLWQKEIRFPYTPGIDATKLCRSNTPSKWVFERVGYERTTTTTTWCRSCSPVAVGLCKPSFKVGPVECVITATAVVGKIYLDNQPEVDEKKEPWDPDQDSEEDCIFTGRWAPMDFCEYICKSGFTFTKFPNVHQEWACERFAKPKEAQK